MLKCQQCSNSFSVPDQDRDFHSRVSPQFNGLKFEIPAPTLCVPCRKIRRYAWRNEYNYYKRNCEKCQKNIVSVYDPTGPYHVYCSDCFLNRNWDPLAYGKEIDFSKPFFEQFNELLLQVPRNTMVNDNNLASENCEYTFNFAYGKNCYLVTTSWYAENCMYTSKSGRLLDVIDCDNVSESELLNECTSCNKLYNCQYLSDSRNCHDCFFGSDLLGCSNCFCCSALTQKQYYIFNQPCTKAEYEAYIAKINLGSYQDVNNWKQKYEEFLESHPRRAVSLLNCENCEGDRLANCKNTIGFGIWNAENVKYEDFGDTPKNSMDILVAGLCEWCYESQVPDRSTMTCFTNYCWSCQDVLYSDDCRNCSHLFGCVGLRQAKYCILNKQYSKAEYEDLVPKLISKMGSDFGEFFPANISFFGYQETIANEFAPLSEAEARSKNFIWKSSETKDNKVIARSQSLKDLISEVEAEDIKDAFCCQKCAKAFKILPMELNLRKKLRSPLPRTCSNCRRAERTKHMNPLNLYNCKCKSCGTNTLSRYNASDSNVVCQDCFTTKVQS